LPVPYPHRRLATVSQPSGPLAYPSIAGRRTGYTGLVAAIVVGSLVWATMMGFCGYLLAHNTLRLSPGTQAVPGSRPRAAGNPLDHTGDLRRFLATPPQNSRPWSEPPSLDGRLTLAQLAARYHDPASATTYLTGLGFAGGAVRTWLERDGTSVEINLLRFATTYRAEDYYLHTVANDVDDMPGDSTIAMISQIPHNDGEVVGFTKKDQYGDQMSHGIAIRGDVVVETWVYQRAPQSVVFTQDVTFRQWTLL
jgi:hypothetical protein